VEGDRGVLTTIALILCCVVLTWTVWAVRCILDTLQSHQRTMAALSYRIDTWKAEHERLRQEILSDVR
jgi:hypothetical protein